LRVLFLSQKMYSSMLSVSCPYLTEDTLAQMPFETRKRLLQHIYKIQLRRIHVFRTLEEGFVLDLLVRLKSFVCHRNHRIIDVGEMADEILFIVKGDVLVSTVCMFACMTSSSQSRASVSYVRALHLISLLVQCLRLF